MLPIQSVNLGKEKNKGTNLTASARRFFFTSSSRTSIKPARDKITLDARFVKGRFEIWKKCMYSWHTDEDGALEC